MPKTWFANKCAGLLHCLFTWEKSVLSKGPQDIGIPRITGTIIDGGVEEPIAL